MNPDDLDPKQFPLLAGLREADLEVLFDTLEPCELWRLSRDLWHRLVEDHPRVACRLLEAILVETAANLRDTLDRFDESRESES